MKTSDIHRSDGNRRKSLIIILLCSSSPVWRNNITSLFSLTEDALLTLLDEVDLMRKVLNESGCYVGYVWRKGKSKSICCSSTNKADLCVECRDGYKRDHPNDPISVTSRWARLLELVNGTSTSTSTSTTVTS